MGVLQDPTVLVEEAVVVEEVALDTGEGDGELGLVEFRRPRFGAADRDGVALPLAPGRRRLELGAAIPAGQPVMVGADHVAAFLGRDRGHEPLPGVGEQHRGAVLVEPAQLALGQQEDAAQDQGFHPLRVGDGIDQGQG